ncbi:MAG: PorP/SprF family type IX secretion system membrane protein [Bacteroidota bacterium]
MNQRFTFASLLCFMFLSWGASAQEPQFSNFYATTLYTNPAFTGRTSHQYQFTTNFRRQWHNRGSFTTGFLSADYAFNRFGVGLTAYTDQAGAAPLTTVQTSASLSYGVQITPKLDFVAGFQGSYYDQRLREDYIWIDDYISNNPNALAPGVVNQYFNLSLGVMLIHKSFWLGGALKDLLPNPGLNTASPYYLVSANRNTGSYYGRFSVHGGYSQFLMPRQLFFTSYANFRSRGTVRQWEAGFNVAYRPLTPGGHAADIVLGMGGGYRGFFRTLENLSTRDAAIVNASITWPKGFNLGSSPMLRHQIQVVYSYDITVSRLSQSGGAHEVTLAFKLSDLRMESSWARTISRRQHIADPRDCPTHEVKDVYVPR